MLALHWVKSGSVNMDKVSFGAVVYTKNTPVPVGLKRILNTAAGEAKIARQIEALDDIGLDVVFFHRQNEPAKLVRANIQKRDQKNKYPRNLQGVYAEGIIKDTDSAIELYKDILTEGFIGLAKAVKKFIDF